MDWSVRPEDVCPEWSDDVRMRALFGPLPSREAHPDAWAGRLRFWSQLVEVWAARADRCLLTLAELGHLFQRQGRTPQCLEEVVRQGRLSGQFAIPSAHLEQLAAAAGGGANSSKAWGAWLRSLGAEVVRTVSSTVMGPGDTTTEEFVIVSQVEKV